MQKEDASQSAVRKLEEFYTGLTPDERKVIGLIIGASLQRAARAQAERDWLVDGGVLLELITPKLAPNIVTELGTFVAGQLAPQLSAKRPLT
jgi:hypothetical protein